MRLAKYYILTIILLVSSVFLQSTSAQDYTRWSLPQGAKLRIGKGQIEDVMYSTDGNHLVVDTSIGFWIYDAHTGQELDFIFEDSKEILGFYKNLSQYVQIDSEEELTVRNYPSRDVRLSLKMSTENTRHVVFSPDGNILTVTNNDKILIWNLSDGELIDTLVGHTSWISHIVFSPDGKTLVSSSSDDTVKLWDISSTTNKTTYTELAISASEIIFGPDGKTLISISFNGDRGTTWDVETGIEKTTFTFTNPNSLALSPDRKTLVIGGSDEMHLWDIVNNKHITQLSGHIRYVDAVAFSPDGRSLASGGTDELFIWDVDSGARIMSIGEHAPAFSSMAISPNENIIATSSYEKMNLWDTRTGKSVNSIHAGFWSHPTNLAFSPDGYTLACIEGLKLILWDVQKIVPITTVYKWGESSRRNTSFNAYNSLAFSPNGELLAAASNDNTVHLWYKGRTYIGNLSGHRGEVTSITFSNDGNILASGSADTTIRLWDVQTLSEIKTFTGYTSDILTVAVNPDNSLVAFGGEDETIMIWDIASEDSTVIYSGHTNGTNKLHFSSDGKTLVSCDSLWYDSSIKLWDVSTGDLITTLIGHTSGITNLDFTSDGKTLVTSSRDGSMLLWDFTPYLFAIGERGLLANDINNDKIVDLQELKALTPKKTALLKNYPNPFNPETWIPYQLSQTENVKINIFSSNGQLIRILDLGNKPAGIYQNHSRAAHWDGKNERGERVASGIYFYTLSAGNYSATQRMVIRK